MRLHTEVVDGAGSNRLERLTLRDNRTGAQENVPGLPVVRRLLVTMPFTRDYAVRTRLALCRYSAASDRPIAALTAGITFSAISSIERLPSALSSQSLPA